MVVAMIVIVAMVVAVIMIVAMVVAMIMIVIVNMDVPTLVSMRMSHVGMQVILHIHYFCSGVVGTTAVIAHLNNLHFLHTQLFAGQPIKI